MTPDVRRASASADDLPYHYGSEVIALGVTGFAVEDGDPGEPNYDDRVVPLYKYEPWDYASVSVSLTIGESDADRLFESDPPYKAKLIVVVDSEATQTRYEEIVENNPFTAGTYEGEVRLEHDLFRETVTLTPRLVRTADSTRGLPYAPKKGMRVAGGESWKVHVDEPEEAGRGFPFVYRDFSDGDYPDDAVHTLRRTPADPAVLVNERHDPIVDVLQTRTFYSRNALLKKVIKAEMGTATWMQLVIHTASTIAESGDPEFEWQEGVVEEITPYLFDDDPSYEDAVERLGENVSEPSELRDFVQELNDVVQLYTDQAEQWNGFLEGFD